MDIYHIYLVFIYIIVHVKLSKNEQKTKKFFLDLWTLLSLDVKKGKV